MYSVERDDNYVTIRVADTGFRSGLTGEVEPSGQIAYRAKNTDLIIIDGAGACEVSEVSDKKLIETLHQKGILS